MLEVVVEHNNHCMDQIFLANINHQIKVQVCYHMAIKIIIIDTVDWIVDSIVMVATIMVVTVIQMALLWIVIIELSISRFVVVVDFEIDWLTKTADSISLLATIARIDSM